MKKHLLIAGSAVLSIALLSGCGTNANGQLGVANQKAPVVSSKISAPAATAKVKSNEVLAKDIMEAAQHGTLPYLPKGLGIGTSNELVFQLWGQPKYNGGRVLNYTKYDTELTLDGVDKVVEIMSNRSEYQKMDINEVMNALGQPTQSIDTSRDIPNTAEALYDIKDQFGQTLHLVFHYNTETKKMIYVKLYFDTQTP